MAPVVSIIGRTNVGKSTLFNRLIGRRRSLVDNQPGVTRDRILAELALTHGSVDLVDTGGLGFEKIDQIHGEVGRQILQTAKDSDVILLMLDGLSGPLPQDAEIVQLLRPLGKKIIAVINKIDPHTRVYEQKSQVLADFYQLGLPTLIPVSSEHGSGIPDLLEAIESAIPASSMSPRHNESENMVRVAFMGRPNVGKSSLVNRILGEPRLIVSDQGGTTRDTVDIKIESNGQAYLLLDTAGLRKRSKVSERIEVFSMIRSIKTIRDADVVALVLDATENITHQDLRISNFICQYGPGLIILANKWDLCKDSKHQRHAFREELFYRAPFLAFSDVRFVSAKDGVGIDGILPASRRIWKGFNEATPEAKLKEIFNHIISSMPTTVQPKGLKLRKMTHRAGKPCVFTFICNRPDLVTQDLQRYLLNRLYENFPLSGIPVHMRFFQS